MLNYIRHMVRAMIKVELQAIKGITVHPHGSVHAPPCNGRLLFADIVLHPAWDDLEVRLPSLLAARALPVLCQPTPRSPGLAASHGVRLCLTARRMRLRLADPHAQVRAAGEPPSLSSRPPPYPPYVTRHINHGGDRPSGCSDPTLFLFRLHGGQLEYAFAQLFLQELGPCAPPLLPTASTTRRSFHVAPIPPR